jgi:hypothetical protein
LLFIAYDVDISLKYDVIDPDIVTVLALDGASINGTQTLDTGMFSSTHTVVSTINPHQSSVDEMSETIGISTNISSTSSESATMTAILDGTKSQTIGMFYFSDELLFIAYDVDISLKYDVIDPDIVTVLALDGVESIDDITLDSDDTISSVAVVIAEKYDDSSVVLYILVCSVDIDDDVSIVISEPIIDIVCVPVVLLLLKFSLQQHTKHIFVIIYDTHIP